MTKQNKNPEKGGNQPKQQPSTPVIKLNDGTTLPRLSIFKREEALKRMEKEKANAWDNFIDLQVEEEVTRRINMLERAFNEYDDTVKSLEKIKPDGEDRFSVPDGKKLPATYSPKKWKERSDLISKEKKLNLAITKAKDNDFSFLEDIYKDM